MGLLRAVSRYLWCERNESSASAHGHTDDCYTERPAPPPARTLIDMAELGRLRSLETAAQGWYDAYNPWTGTSSEDLTLLRAVEGMKT